MSGDVLDVLGAAGHAVPEHPAGSHLARYQDAERRGVLGRQAPAGVIARLDVIAGSVVIPDGAR
jgi:hypothetical protein